MIPTTLQSRQILPRPTSKSLGGRNSGLKIRVYKLRSPGKMGLVWFGPAVTIPMRGNWRVATGGVLLAVGHTFQSAVELAKSTIDQWKRWGAPVEKWKDYP